MDFLLPNTLLNKRYRIVSLLGHGAYGAVYRAWDERAGQDVAIKTYHDPSAAMGKQFREEARRLMALSHPQLPAILDHFSMDDGQYLVTAYVNGVSAAELMAQYGRLPSHLITDWLAQICQPLAYLHESDTVHLNVKPANIHITPAGEVYLVDTGLPGLGIRAGGNGYTAPEVEKQQAIAPASDIYSLGATLYALLTGDAPPSPLRRETGLDTLLPPRDVDPDIEPFLSIVAMRAMALKAETRYESVARFAAALKRPLGQATTPSPVKPTMAAKPKRPFTPRRQMERRTILALTSVLLILIAITAAAAFFNFNREDEPTTAQATVTLESAVIAALTAIAPPPTPLPIPTAIPTPTPEPYVTDSGARMLYMPPATFLMGYDEGLRDEKPAHLLEMNAFYIDETEVTNGQYALCVAEGDCNAPSYQIGASYHDDYYGNADYDDYPVAFVTWNDADAFCEWRGARLPSEAEWEMAASFDPAEGVKSRYPWGDIFDGTNLNFCDSNCPLDGRDGSVDDGHLDTAPVGSYANGRSPIGAYDMAGNVMEWVSDWYGRGYYAESGELSPLGPLEGSDKVLRGGAWLSEADDTTVFARDSRETAVARAQIGFRCAMAVP